jgi:hypothetical protein
MKIYVATNTSTIKDYAEGSMETLRTRLREFKGSEFTIKTYEGIKPDRTTFLKLVEEGLAAFTAEHVETYRVNDAGQLRRVP